MAHSLHRRAFLQHASLGAALATALRAKEAGSATHFPDRAKRVVVLHQSGAPSQIDLFDPKPQLLLQQGKELPEEIRKNQRLTTMTSDQKQKSLVGSPFPFKRHGESGLELSSLLPHLATAADHLCVIRSMHTEAINHDPAITFMYTGSQIPGRPSLGAWCSYGWMRETANAPDFVAMVSGGRPGDQPLSSRLWGAGFLPQRHAAMRMRSGADPLLFLSNPPGIDRQVRLRQLDAIEGLDAIAGTSASGTSDDGGQADVALHSRWQAYRQTLELQQLMPEAADLKQEPEETWRLYGEEARRPGTFAANCVRARRLLERDVPFVQLFHRGWDHHEEIVARLPIQCRETDQASAALVLDLHRRGMLDDTLVVWAGEFGRTAYCQGAIDGGAYGRDHHPRCFSIWLAGAGVKTGVYGETDEFSYNITDKPVHVHDLQATLLHLLGFDHRRLTFRTQGRDYRLTDQFGEVVGGLLGDA
ncbi:MAG: DUF1501 domain-containing protein [Planctomycetales bacterium]|nr:DUF1501 domain-containing protein [Planctomycetales bacterium]